MTKDQFVGPSMILENIPDIVITTDLFLRICTWNRIAEETFGFKEEDLAGKSLSTLKQLRIHSCSFAEAASALRSTGKWKGELEFITPKGNRYFSFTVTYMRNEEGANVGVIGVGKEVTEEKNAQSKLRQNERFYRGLIADSLDGILLLNEDGNVKFASPSIKHILDYDFEEVIGKNAFEFIHPEDRKWAIYSFQREVEESPEIKFIVIRLRKKGGEWLWCMLRGHNLLNNPYVRGVAVYLHDDTLRKKASEALQESEHRFRTLIRDLQVGVLLQDGDGNIEMSNNAFYEMLDTSEREVTGKKFWELFPDIVDENDTPIPLHERPSYKATFTRKLVSDVVIGVMNSKNKRIWMLVNANPILDSEGNVQKVILSFKDVTERRKLEKQLLLEQLNLQRQLTQASITSQENERREIGKELHDNYGQQLTTVKLYLDLAKSTADEMTGEMIALSLRSISDVINGIRALSRSLIPSTLGDLGLVDSINDLIESITRTRKIDIHLDHEYFSESKVTENFKLMLFRIVQEQLNNILKHAEASHVHIILQNEGGFQFLEITDDGKGFDTKNTRKGLGLVNIRNRAEMFGGNVEIRTGAGKGCSVVISIPLDNQDQFKVID